MVHDEAPILLRGEPGRHYLRASHLPAKRFPERNEADKSRKHDGGDPFLRGASG